MASKLLKAVVATVAAVSLTAHAQAPQVLKIQDYPGLGNLMTRVAIANKTCEKHGITCELRVIPSAPLGLQTLMSGDIDVAFGNPEATLQAFNKGADIRIVSGGLRDPVFFLMAGAHLETPNASKGYPAVMADFKGKRIGVVARGTGSEFQLVDMLKGAGMKADDVTIVAVGAPNTALPAIANKQVDGLISFEPMGGFCEVLKPCRIVVDPRKNQGPEDILKVRGAATFFTVRASDTAKRPAAYDGFARAMKETEAFMQNPANYAAVEKIAGDTFKIDVPNGAAIVSTVLKNSLPSYITKLDPAALQNAADYMFKTQQIDKLVDTSKMLQLR